MDLLTKPTRDQVLQLLQEGQRWRYDSKKKNVEVDLHGPFRVIGMKSRHLNLVHPLMERTVKQIIFTTRDTYVAEFVRDTSDWLLNTYPRLPVIPTERSDNPRYLACLEEAELYIADPSKVVLNGVIYHAAQMGQRANDHTEPLFKIYHKTIGTPFLVDKAWLDETLPGCLDRMLIADGMGMSVAERSRFAMTPPADIVAKPLPAVDFDLHG